MLKRRVQLGLVELQVLLDCNQIKLGNHRALLLTALTSVGVADGVPSLTCHPLRLVLELLLLVILAIVSTQRRLPIFTFLNSAG